MVLRVDKNRGNNKTDVLKITEKYEKNKIFDLLLQFNWYR